MVHRVFISVVIALSVLTGCSKHNEAGKSFTAMKLDGKDYSSVIMYSDSYSISGKNEVFKDKGDSFKLRYEHSMTAGESESLEFLLRVIDDEHYKTGVKYRIPDNPTSLDEYSTARITIEENGRKMHYYAQDGWLELDDIQEETDNEDGEIKFRYYRISGQFEFSAKEEHSGKVIKVTEGYFHNTLFVANDGQYMTMK